ncbi:MAG: hypothetical protein FD180_3089 [Planctomycetota bacterium]|nr:MAG: hypothetical protein FD180_3089 [Planctomycetota bacterium]
MDRVFLDANILFSAAWFRESGMRRLWRMTGVLLLTSEYAAAEARKNLDSAKRLSDLERLLEGVTVLPQPEAAMPAEARPLPVKDRPILAAAVHARATHLLTGDFMHFGPFFGKKIRGVEVLAFAQYLESRRLRGLDSPGVSGRSRKPRAR